MFSDDIYTALNTSWNATSIAKPEFFLYQKSTEDPNKCFINLKMTSYVIPQVDPTYDATDQATIEITAQTIEDSTKYREQIIKIITEVVADFWSVQNCIYDYYLDHYKIIITASRIRYSVTN